MFKLSLSIFILSSVVAVAEEQKLTGPEIMIVLADKTYQQIRPTTKHRIEQTFQSGGNTHFVVDGQLSQGLWRVEADQYCSSWPPSTDWDCYDILRLGEEIVFLSARGARYVFVKPLP